VKLSEVVKPISYLKAHAAEVIREIAEKRKTVIVTQHGEAKAVLQDVRTYEELQESLALLKILAQGQKSAEEGRLAPAAEAFGRVRRRAARRARG
jgi:prevent-host-death family protein